MNKTIYETYSPDTDMTFILEDTFKDDDLISTEVKGFYFGKPNDEYTKQFYGKMKAVLE